MNIFKCFSKQKIKECENNFIRNGSLLQQELVVFCNGKNFPIHIFSATEVMKMSNFTHSQLLKEDIHFRLYQGTTDEGSRAICIKKFHSIHAFVGLEGIVREIVLATQMSMHRNSLKLLGCCLETDFPVILYEFPDKGCLAHCTYREEGALPWTCRLKIALDISYALAYLQNGFGRPVIYRNLSSKDVFLDKDYVAKLTGFYFSVLIPEGEVHVNDAIVGTTGYNAPEYIRSGRLTEKTDVYCFGVLLFELLVGHCRYHGGYLNKVLYNVKRDHDRSIEIGMIVDPKLSREIEENGKEQQLQEVFELTLRCTRTNEDDRPSIIDVASELKKISDSSSFGRIISN